MRTILLAYLMIFCRHTVFAYLYHYSDTLFDWCRSIYKMRISSWVTDDRSSRSIQLKHFLRRS
jgi:hypothetical protein